MTWTNRPEWQTVTPLDLSDFDTVLVLAAHPDDETLGAGGLIATAAAAGLDVALGVFTAGEHSHPNSTTHPPELLARRREAELRAAANELAPAGVVWLLDLEDGRVAEHEQELVEVLVPALGDARRTLVVAPWRHDGHPDHEAVGRAAATAAHRTGATLWEYPIWWWHWASPADAPWADLAPAPELSSGRHRASALAALAHASQVLTEPLSTRAGDRRALSCEPQFVTERTSCASAESVLRPRRRGHALDESFDAHQARKPVGRDFDRSWYERRKRDL